MGEPSRYLVTVLDGQVTSADSVEKGGSNIVAYRDSGSTVRCLMASTFEREFDPDVLTAVRADETHFALPRCRETCARGGILPAWAAELVNRLLALRSAAN